MNEEVQLEINDRKGFFYIKVNDKTEAKMTFVFAGPEKIIIDHTEVNEGNNGKGYGKKNGSQSSRICQRKKYQNHSAMSFCQKSF